MTARRTNRGQLALGLAFAFLTILGMFSLVFRSSLLTREKMKLQQTTDFAALVAADVQRHNLNRIKEINEAIEIAYAALQTIMAANFAPCLQQGLDTTVSTGTLAKVFGGYVLTKLTGNPDLCNLGCNAYEGFFRTMLLQHYQTTQSAYASDIMNILSKANQYAYEKALDTYLLPGNLPVGLRRHVETTYGTQLDLQMVRALYRDGKLKKLYEISDANQKTPLHEVNIENRAVMIVVNGYADPPMYIGDGVKCIHTYSYPLPLPTSVKVVKKGDYNSSFITAATYQPLVTKILRNFDLVLKEQRDGKTRDARDVRGGKLKLFRGEENRMQSPMIAMAAAKPYGGSYAEAGTFLPSDFGTTGKKWKGAKLLGVADEKQLGMKIGVIGTLQTEDTDLKRKDKENKIFSEDILH